MMYTPAKSHSVLDMSRLSRSAQMGTQLSVEVAIRIRLWDAKTGAHRRTLAGHDMSAVSYSTRMRIVSWSFDESIRVWNSVTGEHKHIFKGVVPLTTVVTFSPDGSRLACAIR